jgi:signal transduction histidine kinase
MAILRRRSLRVLSVPSASLHVRLLSLVAIALLPVVVLAIAGLLALGRQQHAQAQQALLERVRAIASAVDLELFNSVEALKILALSASLDTANLGRFHAEAKAALQARSDWDGILVLDPAGRWLLNTKIPYGSPLPAAVAVEKESFEALLATRRPSIGNIAKGPLGQYRFPVRVPVVRGSELRYVLTAIVKPDLVREILERQKVPEQSVSTIFDGRLSIVARSRNQEQYVGSLVSVSLARLMGNEGEGGGVTITREGQAVYTAFARSTRGPWGTALGVPKDLVDAPIWRSYALSGVGIVLSLVLGVMTADWLARRIARQLEQANTELQAANRELEAFSYSVSHDLRAPLRAIDGYSSMLLEESASLSDEGRRHLGTVRANAGRMTMLIDDLLAFARLGRRSVSRERFEMRALVEECLTQLRAETADRAIECAVGELPACDADPALIRQVLLNLIGNAFKYTGKTEQARVEIGCQRRGREDVFYVRDNGVGFDMAHAAKLFGVFQRLHRSEEFEGTGVGLAIVQRIVQRHGGGVWAEAQPGKGATFYFTLKPG